MPQRQYPLRDKASGEPEPIAYQRNFAPERVREGFEELLQSLENTWEHERDTLRNELRSDCTRFSDWLMALVEVLAKVMAERSVVPNEIGQRTGLHSLARLMQARNATPHNLLLMQLAIAWMWARGWSGRTDAMTLLYAAKKLRKSARQLKNWLMYVDDLREIRKRAKSITWGFQLPPTIIMLCDTEDRRSHGEMIQHLVKGLVTSEPDLECLNMPLFLPATLSAIPLRAKPGDIVIVFWAGESSLHSDALTWLNDLLKLTDRQRLFVVVIPTNVEKLPDILKSANTCDIVPYMPFERGVAKVISLWRTSVCIGERAGALVVPSPQWVQQDPEGVDVLVRSDQFTFAHRFRVSLDKPSGEYLSIFLAHPALRKEIEKQSQGGGIRFEFSLGHQENSDAETTQELDLERSFRAQGVAAGSLVWLATTFRSAIPGVRAVEGKHYQGEDYSPTQRLRAQQQAWEELQKAFEVSGLRLPANDSIAEKRGGT